jgi:hypothetical protein
LEELAVAELYRGGLGQPGLDGGSIPSSFTARRRRFELMGFGHPAAACSSSDKIA